MSVKVDATGLACPMPVVMAKNALKENTSIVVIVDNSMAMENVRRLGAKLGCSVEIDTINEKEFHIHLTRPEGLQVSDTASDEEVSCKTVQFPLIAVISSELMGTGDTELGKVLMKAFIHTLLQLDELPEKILFYNSGVKLSVNNSDVIDDLKTLAESGVELLLCGTCVNFYGIKDSLGTGKLTNMLEIASIMSSTSRLLKP